MKINDILVEAPPARKSTSVQPIAGAVPSNDQAAGNPYPTYQKPKNQPRVDQATRRAQMQRSQITQLDNTQPAPVDSTQPLGAAQTPPTTTPTTTTTAPTDTTAQAAKKIKTTTGGNPWISGMFSAAKDELGMPNAGAAEKAFDPKVATTTVPGTGTTGQTGGPDTTGQTGAPGTTGQTGGATPTSTPAADGQTGQPNTAAQGQEPGQQADANKDPQFKIFKDPNAFKSEWDKYVATKSQPYQLIADPQMLTALKDMWMRSGGTRVESRTVSKKAQRLIEQRIMKDPIYESFSRVGCMIAEAELTQQQIQQIFQAVADGAAAGGNVQKAGDEPVNNRTWVGKGGDMVAKVAKAWDGVKTKISQSAPVAGFDQSVDAIQDKLLKAAGGESGTVGQALAKYREFGKQHPIFQGAIYAGLIALAGISGAGLGGAALLAGIKTFDRLLQGDKASSALWSGFKTGAIAYGASQLLHPNQPPGIDNPVVGPDGNPVVPPGGDGTLPPGGDGTVPPSQNIDPTNPDAWADGTQANGTDTIPYTVQQGETLSQIAKSNGISVKDIMDNNPSITNPNNLPTGIELQLPQNVENYNVYDQGVGTAADTAAKVSKGQYVPTWGSKSTVNSSYIPMGRMISEYIDYNATMRSRMLAEMRGMPQNGCYLTAAGVKAIFEGVVNEGPWDAIKGAYSKVAGGVEKFGQGVADVAKKGYNAAANKITLDKLDLNWRKNYKEFDPTGGEGPVDSEQVKAFLRKQGVTDVLINKVFGDLGLDTPAPADQAQAPAQAAGFSTGAAFTDLFKKFSDGGGNLAPQVRGVLKDILLTAMRTVESMQRKRMYGAPVLSEVRTDFSAALLKSLK